MHSMFIRQVQALLYLLLAQVHGVLPTKVTIDISNTLFLAGDERGSTQAPTGLVNGEV